MDKVTVSMNVLVLFHKSGLRKTPKQISKIHCPRFERMVTEKLENCRRLVATFLSDADVLIHLVINAFD